ncbi:MAG: BON domain-containing protein [Gemmatimonadaceae bacterium]
MERDFENIHDIDNLSEQELRQLVRTHLAAHNMLDPDDLAVRIEDGVVVLGGRVGTEGERRVAEHVVTDVLGITSVRNEILIDPIRRGESPEAIDDHLAEEERTAGLLLGDNPAPFDDEAEPIDGRDRYSVDKQAFGTTDVQDAIAGGTTWIPPESPTQEGMSGVDADEADLSGEDH